MVESTDRLTTFALPEGKWKTHVSGGISFRSHSLPLEIAVGRNVDWLLEVSELGEVEIDLSQLDRDRRAKTTLHLRGTRWEMLGEGRFRLRPHDRRGVPVGLLALADGQILQLFVPTGTFRVEWPVGGELRTRDVEIESGQRVRIELD